jgi:hypothetical protein
MKTRRNRIEEPQRLRERGGRRHKAGQGRTLDELCAQYGDSRKHAITLLTDTLPRRWRWGYRTMPSTSIRCGRRRRNS